MTRARAARAVSRTGHVGRPSVCVVGSGWQFTSGISYYTCRLTTALAESSDVSALLMRRLIPRRLYPGRDRVGKQVNQLSYPPQIPVFDGVDWYWGWSMIGAIRHLRRQRPDVLVLQWWTGAVLHSYLLLTLVARSLGAKVVVEFHEVQDTGEARLRGVARYTRRVSAWLLSHVDAYVVHSEHDRAAVTQAYPTQHATVRVLPHGPFDHHLDDDDDTAGRPSGARADDSPVADCTTVLFFGTIRPYKGLEHLVAAFDLLGGDEAARLRLLIVGETWEGWTKPLTDARRSRHAERIEIVNSYVADDEIATFFGRADAVVLPYLRSSASGPLHIAMAYGLPVVLSDVGGLRDGAEGYEGITWVPPGDPVALAAALRGLPARRGERFADPRSWSHSAAVFGEMFAELVTR